MAPQVVGTNLITHARAQFVRNALRFPFAFEHVAALGRRQSKHTCQDVTHVTEKPEDPKTKRLSQAWIPSVPPGSLGTVLGISDTHGMFQKYITKY